MGNLLPTQDEVNKSYSPENSLWWQIAVAAMYPPVGSSIIAIYNFRAQKVAQERAKGVLQGLANELAKISEDKIDKKYLDSEEWADLVIRTTERAARIRNKDRRALLVKILKGAVLHELDSIGNPEDLVDIIYELNDEELLVLGGIYLQYKKDGKPIDDKTVNQILPEKVHLKIPLLLKRLESKGLLDEFKLRSYDGSHRLTDAAIRICDYLLPHS